MAFITLFLILKLSLFVQGAAKHADIENYII